MDKYDRALIKHNHKELKKKRYLRMCQVSFTAGALAGYLISFMVLTQFLAK